MAAKKVTRTMEDRVASLERTVAALATTVSSMTRIIELLSEGKAMPKPEPKAETPAPAPSPPETPAPTPEPKPAPRVVSRVRRGFKAGKWGEESYNAAFAVFCAYGNEGFSQAVIDSLKKDTFSNRYYAGKSKLYAYFPTAGRACVCVTEATGEHCRKCKNTRNIVIQDVFRMASHAAFQAAEKE